MNLKKLVGDCVDLAFEIAVDAVAEVTWTFLNGIDGDYDAFTETRTGSSVDKTVTIIPYVDKRNDDSHNFSSTGQFIDPPVEQDEFEIMIRVREIDPLEPSNQDSFLWPNADKTQWVKFSVKSVERFPIKSIYIVKCFRS